MRLLVLALFAITVAGCSDRVPAPVTPTPSPLPGYPPAPVSELPEGVLFVNKPRLQAPAVFRLGPGRDAQEIGQVALGPVSPDGSRAVAQTYSGKSVTEIGLITGARYEAIARGRWLMGTPWFVWSNDSRRLAYMLTDETDPAKASIWAFDTEVGETTLLTAEASEFWALGWTPAGDVLVRTPEGLALLGKTRRPIALPEPGSVLDTQMSPDGRSVAVKLGGYEQDPATGIMLIHASGIWVLELTDGGWRELVRLADEPPEVMTTGGQEMRWSSDGMRITLHRTRIEENGLIADGLSVIDVRTGNETRVHDQGWGWESWSPDRNWLAITQWKAGFLTFDTERRLSIWDTNGGTREVDAYARGFAWTKDGRLLVDIPGHLSLLDPGTMEIKEVLTEDGASITALLEAPVWSPSGRYFALSTPADQYNKSSLYIVDTEKATAELFFDEAGFVPVAWLQEQAGTSWALTSV